LVGPGKNDVFKSRDVFGVFEGVRVNSLLVSDLGQNITSLFNKTHLDVPKFIRFRFTYRKEPDFSQDL